MKIMLTNFKFGSFSGDKSPNLVLVLCLSFGLIIVSIFKMLKITCSGPSDNVYSWTETIVEVPDQFLPMII